MCIGASGPSGTSRRGSGHRPVRGGGPGKGVGVKARVGSVSGASGHTLRRVSEVRQGVCRGVGAHVKARVRGGCVRVSGVCQDVRRGGAYREYPGRASGTRAQAVLRYCDFFRKKFVFLGKSPIFAMQVWTGSIRRSDISFELNSGN